MPLEANKCILRALSESVELEEMFVGECFGFPIHAQRSEHFCIYRCLSYVYLVREIKVADDLMPELIGVSRREREVWTAFVEEGEERPAPRSPAPLHTLSCANTCPGSVGRTKTG